MERIWFSRHQKWVWLIVVLISLSVVFDVVVLRSQKTPPPPPPPTPPQYRACGEIIDWPDWNERMMSPDTIGLMQPGGRSQQLPNIKTDKIKAYVLTTNSSGVRWLISRKVLKDCGFEPIPVKPIHWNSSFIRQMAYPYKSEQLLKTFSNKYSFRMVWDWIASDPTIDDMEIPFSLIFEDDIALNSEFHPSQVEGIARQTAKLTKDVGFSGLFYLGVGMGRDSPYCDESGKYVKVFNNVSYNVCNGRLFHATGLLKYEGKWLADRVTKMAEFHTLHGELPYMDAQVQMAFRLLDRKFWPYAAAWNQQDPSIDMKEIHRGVFYQDRTTNPSGIGGWDQLPQDQKLW